ncbi:MAG: protein-export chaperone SecB [Alphaproteobacteria bacterium]|nr:protein-export chaperone SecB [Alphaproteobacteria bacterium]
MSENTVQEITNMPINVHSQYVKDISFENPNAPFSLRAGQAFPEMDVNISMDARTIESEKIKNLHEVTISVNVEAIRDGKTVFVGELLYGVMVSIGEEVPEESYHPLLLIEVPRMAFPFVRQIMADLTIKGGYPPLLITPIDFHALYVERFKDNIKGMPKKQKNTTH